MGRAATADVAFEEFFRSNYARAFGVAVRMLGNAAEAEDAVAEAFARALVRWRRVGDLDYRDAWVLRVTANVAIDVLRRRRTLSVPQSTARDAQADSVERLTLLNELETLPERQRDVLLLRYFGDLSDDDIARCLAMAQGTVKSHVHRGLSRLRRQFGVGDHVADMATPEGKEVRVAVDLHH